MEKISLDVLEKKFKEQNYITGDNVLYAVYTAICLEKPLLVDGPAGVGKTELAKTLSKILDAKLIRLQCYEGIDASKALYEVDYAKKLQRQVLFQGVAQGDISRIMNGRGFSEVAAELENEIGLNGKEYIIERPVYEAINPDNKYKKVLLIDEIDKADMEVENMLLEPLSDYSMSIPELGTISCDLDNKPFFVLTSNNQREISEPLRRRCVYLYIDYPTIATEMEILISKANVSEEFAKDVATLVSKIRSNLDLRQNPSIAESIEWANVLFNHLGVESITKKFLNEIKLSLSALSKNNKDLDKISNYLDSQVQ